MTSAEEARFIALWNAGTETAAMTITASPQTACTGRMHPRTRQVEVRCR